jgi:7-cyano-7-deazaguanine synthase in queuosine biosynthesis
VTERGESKIELPAVVLVSGGLDSATALALAIDRGFAPLALSFRYGQRHVVEIDAARAVAAAAGVAEHRIIDIDLRQFGGSALTADIEVPKRGDGESRGAGPPGRPVRGPAATEGRPVRGPAATEGRPVQGPAATRAEGPVGWASPTNPDADTPKRQDEQPDAGTLERRDGGRCPPYESACEPAAATIPVTYVPARNTIFLSCALAFAEVRGARDIFIGVNAVDYSGYPDCRPEYLAAFERMAALATRAGVGGEPVRIHAPLIDLAKERIIRRGLELGVDYGLTRSCYDPDPAGRGCGRCDSCRIRLAAFAKVGVPDPAPYI